MRKSIYRLPSYIAKNTGEIPEWFRRANIYSPIAPPLTCNSKYNAIKNVLHTEIPRGANDSLRVSIGSLRKIDPSIPVDTDVWFFMWAAHSRDLDKTETQCAENSYRDFSNCGLFKSSNGHVTFHFITPVPYMEEGILYPPHIHFTRLMPNDTWEVRAWAINVPPVLEYSDFEKVRRNSEYLVINCLDKRPNPDIPGTLHISSHATLRKIDRRLRNILGHTKKRVRKPIVIYCLNPICDSSQRMMRKLLRLGYSNQLVYPGGLQDWLHNN